MNMHQHFSYLTDTGHCVEFALDGRDPIEESWAEDDAVGSVCKVWYLRQLIQEPGAQPHWQ